MLWKRKFTLCNGSRYIVPIAAELGVLGAGIYRVCLPHAGPLKVVRGVKGPRRACRRAPYSSGPLWSFGLHGEDNLI